VSQHLLKFFFFVFTIFFILFCTSGCEKNYSTLVDTASGVPFIRNASFSVSVVNTDTINLAGHPLRSPDDTVTIRGIAQVKIDSSANGANISFARYSVFDFSSSLTEGTLHDDGIPPDINAHDNIYSGDVEFQIQRVFVGTLSINLWSESTAGYRSNTSVLPLQIIRINHPPVLSNLVVDSLISIKGINQKFFPIVIKAADPDGQSDVRIVYFNSYKPNGSPALGNPFLMYDDGNINGTSGDYAAGDEFYSLRVGLPTAAGTYRFEFFAVDRSNDTSNAFIKNIVVTN
jgi:hypothetical protein